MQCAVENVILSDSDSSIKLSGIPYLILVLRIIYTVDVAFDPRFLLYAYQCFITVITGNDDWIHCQDYVGVRCFDPTISCKVNEFLVNGMCIKDAHFTDLPLNQDFGLLTYFGFRDQRLVSLIPAQIFKEINDLDTNNHILVALCYLIIAGFITYKGRQFFASIAGFFAFLPIVGMIPTVVLFYYDVGSRKKNFLKEILSNNDISKIFQMSAWLDAARVTIRTLYIADGTLMALGSMGDFRHNFVKDAFLLAAFGAAYRILLCFGILPIFYAGNDILYPFSSEVHAEGEKIQFHAVELLFSALPSYSIPGIGLTIQFFVYALLFGTLNFAAIAYQVITLEILINSLHHVFPRLLYLKKKIVRVFIIIAAAILLLFVYISYLPGKEGLSGYMKEREIDEYFEGLISTTVLIQLLAVSMIYGYKRLLINILTMLKHHSITYRLVEKCRFFLYAMWAIFLPAASVYSMFTIIVKQYQIYNSFNLLYAGINAIPLIYFVRKLILYLINGEYVSNLSQTHRWQPANEGHAREVEHDERASGVLN